MEADNNIEQEINSLGSKKEVFLLWGKPISETPTTASQRQNIKIHFNRTDIYLKIDK